MKLKEMAIRGGRLRTAADNFSNMIKGHLEKNSGSFTHVGDIDGFRVSTDGKFYLVLDTEKVIAICALTRPSNGGYVVDDAWVDSKYTGKRLFSKILWFLSSRESFNPLYFGNVHSDETYDFLKSGGFSKFKKTWVNHTLNLEEPFSVDTIDKFYSSTKWKLKLEVTEELNEMMEEVSRKRFLVDGYIACAYDWQLVQI
jgi:hypothetical protein